MCRCIWSEKKSSWKFTLKKIVEENYSAPEVVIYRKKCWNFGKMLLTKKGNCRIKQTNKINPLNLAVIHNITTRSTPRKVASLKKEKIYFQQGVLISLFWLVWYSCTGNANFFQNCSRLQEQKENLKFSLKAWIW